MEPMLKRVAVVTGAAAARSRKPYPCSSTMLASLINASAAPGTLSVAMSRSIKASASGNSAAHTECDIVTTATAIQAAHAAGRRRRQLRSIVFAPIRLCVAAQRALRRSHGQGGFRWWKIQKLARQTQLARSKCGNSDFTRRGVHWGGSTLRDSYDRGEIGQMEP